MSVFSDWLDDTMHKYGKRQYGAAALARDLSVRRATVSDWLNDKHEPTKVQISMLARHFGTTSRHIYGLLGKEPPPDLNDLLEQVNAFTYRLGQNGLQKLWEDLNGGGYGEK